MRFSDIPGHEEAKNLLRQMADTKRIPHALLLEGPAGIGKHALARAFLQYAACPNKSDGDSCGQCASCRQFEAMQHIDTIYSFPYVKRKNASAASPTIANDYLPEFIEFVHEQPYMDASLWLRKLGMPNTPPTIFVEEANELIRRLSFASHSLPYNAVIIWQVDKLNESASNKLLKLIEEPPGNSVIVMTSDSSLNILPTIYSRTQRIKLKRLPDDAVAQWLAENKGIDVSTAAQLAPLAQGSLSEAARIADSKEDTKVFLEYFISLMRLAYKRDIAALKTWSQQVASEKRDTIVAFLEYMASMIRENFIANMKRPELNLMTVDEKNFSTNFARFIHERNIEALFNETSKAIADIRANVNAKIVLFDLAITVILKLK